MAAAAAMAGLIRCVRPPRPCRPSKLRFEVEAQRSPAPAGRRSWPGHDDVWIRMLTLTTVLHGRRENCTPGCLTSAVPAVRLHRQARVP